MSLFIYLYKTNEGLFTAIKFIIVSFDSHFQSPRVPYFSAEHPPPKVDIQNLIRVGLCYS